MEEIFKERAIEKINKSFIDFKFYKITKKIGKNWIYVFLFSYLLIMINFIFKIDIRQISNTFAITVVFFVLFSAFDRIYQIIFFEYIRKSLNKELKVNIRPTEFELILDELVKSNKLKF